MNQPTRRLSARIVLGIAACLPLLLGFGGFAATTAVAEPWIHIKVVDTGDDGETVRVNLPLSLVQAMIPLMDHSVTVEETEDGDPAGDTEAHHGPHHSSIRLNHHDVSPAEMRALLEAFRKAEDGEYVAVDGVDEKVRVTKQGGYFLVDVDDHSEDHEQVRVRMSMDVLEALLSGSDDELNFEAAARALANHAGEDLVTVISEDETVRIWIDEEKTSD